MKVFRTCLICFLGFIFCGNLGMMLGLISLAQDDDAGAILAKKVDPTCVAIQHGRAGGSGFIISPDGYIISNGHVAMSGEDPEKPMAPAKRITVILSNDKKYQARVVGYCKDPDIALMKIEPAAGEKFFFVELGDSDQVKMGQRSYAYGMPLGLKRTLTAGIVSNIERTDLNTFTKVFQTDAPINPGNSGGPLFNEKGEVIGINTYKSGAEGLGYTIPINIAKVVKDYILKYGYFRRATLPYFVAKPLTDDLTKAYRVRDGEGIFVDFVAPNSPAAKAGLATGDIIIEMNNDPISAKNEVGYRDFRWKLVNQEIGSAIEFKVLRGKEEHIIKGTLIEDEPIPEGSYSMGGALGGELPEFHYDALGLALKKMTIFTYYLYNLPKLEGVRLTRILLQTPAAKAGIASNDLITAIDDVPVSKIEQFQKELEARLTKRQKYICLTLMRGKETIKTALKPDYALAGKKVALLVPEKDSEYFELIKRIIIEHGAELTITSSAKEIIISPQEKIKVDVLVSELKVQDFDVLILIGGKGAEGYWEDKKVHEVIRTAVKEKKVLGAIGAASITLINAEPLLLKKKITTDEDYSKIALEKKANYTGKDIEEDKNIITTTGFDTQIIKSFLGKLKSILKGEPR